MLRPADRAATYAVSVAVEALGCSARFQVLPLRMQLLASALLQRALGHGMWPAA